MNSQAKHIHQTYCTNINISRHLSHLLPPYFGIETMPENGKQFSGTSIMGWKHVDKICEEFTRTTKISCSSCFLMKIREKKQHMVFLFCFYFQSVFCKDTPPVRCDALKRFSK